VRLRDVLHAVAEAEDTHRGFRLGVSFNIARNSSGVTVFGMLRESHSSVCTISGKSDWLLPVLIALKKREHARQQNDDV